MQATNVIILPIQFATYLTNISGTKYKGKDFQCKLTWDMQSRVVWTTW